jgi:hypothetical protein
MKMRAKTMMHCDTKLLPAVIDYAQQLLEVYSESEIDESVSFIFAILSLDLFCRVAKVFRNCGQKLHF